MYITWKFREFLKQLAISTGIIFQFFAGRSVLDYPSEDD